MVLVYTQMQEEIYFIEIYIDDIILAGHSDRRIQDVKDALAVKFNMNNSGKLHYFLGIKVLQDDKSKSICIGEPSLY